MGLINARMVFGAGHHQVELIKLTLEQNIGGTRRSLPADPCYEFKHGAPTNPISLIAIKSSGGDRQLRWGRWLKGRTGASGRNLAATRQGN